MTSSFMQNPMDRASADILADAPRRAQQGLGAIRPKTEAPKPPTPDTPKAFFDDLGTRTGLPPNVLWAMSEGATDTAGVEGAALDLQVATEQAGGDVKAAVRALYGDRGTAVLERSFDIAADQYPRDEADQPGVVGDIGRAVAGGVQQGVGMVAAGAGRLVGSGNDFSLVEELTGFDPDLGPVEDVADAVSGFVGDGLVKVGDWLNRMGETDLRSMSDVSRKAMTESGLDGDIFSPSTLKFKGDPTLRGISLMSANVLGNLAPVVVASIFSGGMAAAGVGAAQGFEGGAQTAEDVTQQAFDEGRLQTDSTYFKAQIENGSSPAEALAKTKQVAALAGGGLAAIVAGAGGAATGGIVKGAVGAAAGGSVGRRVAASAVAGAVEEGVQEAVEGVAARQGANMAGGAGSNITEQTGGDAFAGILGGGPAGAAGGVASAVAARRRVLPDDIPAADPMADPAVAPVGGPLAQAESRLIRPEPEVEPAQPLYPDLKAGDSVLIRNPRTGETRPVTFLGEVGNGVEVRAEGGRKVIPAAVFDGLRYEGDLDDKGRPTDAAKTKTPDAKSTPAGVPAITGDGPAPVPNAQSVAVANRSEPEATPRAPDAAPPAPEPGSPRPVGKSRLVALDGADLMAVETDAKTFQYKAGGDDDGVTDRLKKIRNWHRMAAAGAMVYEYADGRRTVVDGHQRLGLAKRLASEGQDVGMDVFLVREADGITPAEAMVAAALNNIRQGSGTAIDAAKVLRNIEGNNDDLDLPPNSPLVRDALGLRNLSPDAWGMVTNEVATVRDGAAVGSRITNPDLHSEALKIMASAKPKSIVEAETIASQIEMDAEGVDAETVSDLFGDQEVARSHYAERGAVMAGALRRLKNNRALSKTLAKRGNEIEGIGDSRIDRDANSERLAQDDVVTTYVQRQAQTKGPISDALKAAAARFAGDRNLGPAVTEFIEAVRQAVPGAVQKAAPDREGSGDSPAPAPQRQPVATTPATPEPETSPDVDPFEDALNRTFGAEPASEKTDAGQQSLIPGVDPVTDRQRAETEAAKPKRGGDTAPASGRGDLFGDPMDRADLFDAPPASADTKPAAPAKPTRERAADIRKEAEKRAAVYGPTPSGERNRGDMMVGWTGKTPMRLFDLMAGEADTKEGRRKAADEWVITLGRERGVEFYVLSDKDGYPLEIGSGRKNGITFSNRFGQSDVVAYGTHNHPSSRGLSAMDIAILGYMADGVKAMPHDGGAMPSTARLADGVEVDADLLVLLTGSVERALTSQINDLIDRTVSADIDEANAVFHHLANRVMADLGVIIYDGPGADLTDYKGRPIKEITDVIRLDKDVSYGLRRAGLPIQPEGTAGVDQAVDGNGTVGDAGRGSAERAEGSGSGGNPGVTAPRPASAIAKDIKGILDGLAETTGPFTAPQRSAYDRLRPLFREALTGSDLASMSKADAFVAMMKPLVSEGLTRDDVTKLRPFFEAHYDAETGTDQETPDVSGTGTDLERDRGDGSAGNSVGGTDVPAALGPDGDSLGARGSADRQATGNVTDAGGDILDVSAPPARSGSDRGVAAGQGNEPDGSKRAPDDVVGGGRGGDSRTGRADADGDGQGDADADAATAADVGDRAAQQARADKTAVKPADAANIAATLPLLLPEQRDDVLKIEERFAKPDGHGMLVTNGTGTGKTYSGGGIIKRFVQQGKTNILVMAPSDGILNAWLAMGKDLGIPMSRLPDTKTAGEGVVLATYANVADNPALADRDWDLIVPDESHSLMQNAAGEATGALRVMRAIANRPDDIWYRARMPDQAAWDKMQAMEDGEPREQERSRLNAKAEAAKEALKGKPRSKVLFLSATPFAYDKTIDYAEGFLFNYGAAGTTPNGSNQGGRELFMVSNFGYRIRYHKLTQPEAGVDSGVFEREFHDRMRRDGVLIGRSLDIDADYDRRFVAVESREGEKLDAAFKALDEAARAAPKSQQSDWNAVTEAVRKNFTYLRRAQLLEAIKAEKAVPEIKAHLAMGRKVVVFHDYNKGGGTSPFRLTDNGKLTGDQHDLLNGFIAGNADARGLNFGRLSAPIDTFAKAFGDKAAFYNGRETKGARAKAVEAFNTDGSGTDVIIVQSDAGSAGISLHDLTGAHQRALFNIGLPPRPTVALQEEGRIRRVGSVTDAMFRYMTIGTAWERQAFSDKIAGRSGTVENLALGSSARKIREAFIQAYLDADTNPAGVEGEGKGGRDADARSETASPYEIARTHYFGRMKDTRRRSARAGIEHYATPEPVGLFMAQAADLRPLERALEPSAGDGAIARYLPGHAERTMIEPDTDLRTSATLVAVGANAIGGTFEDHNVVNKYDAVVMNPPFGRGGSTAVEHVGKAMSHLNPGGRIVALIPTGPAADAKFEKMQDGAVWARYGMHLIADIALPQVTFEKAGTGVATRIVVIERPFDKKTAAPQTKIINLTGADKITDLFDRIEQIALPDRPVAPVEVEPDAVGDTDTIADDAQTKAPETPAATDAPTLDPARDAEIFDTFGFTHTKTGAPIYGTAIREDLSRPRYVEVRDIAKTHGGWWSNYRGGGAQRGFLFKTEAGRDAFKAEYAQSAGMSEADGPFSVDRTEAIAALRDRLRELGLAGRVALRAAERIIGQGPDGTDIDIEGYQDGTVIGIAMAAADPTATLDHEAIHALRDPSVWGRPHGAFTQAEWRALVRTARRDKGLMADVRRDYPDLGTEAQIEEAVARMFSDWRKGKGPKTSTTLMQRIADILDGIRAALTGVKRTDGKDVMEDIASGNVAARDPVGQMVADAAREGKGARQSRPRNSGDRPNSWLDDIPTRLKAAKTDASTFFENYLTDAMTGSGKFNSLSLVPGHALFEELGSWSHALRSYLKLKETMDADRNEMQAEIDAIAQEWLRLGGSMTWKEAVSLGLKGRGRRAQAAQANADLMDLMHRATLSGIDPSRPFERTDAYQAPNGMETKASQTARISHAKLRTEFLAMPKGFQALFRKVAKSYVDTSRAFDDAILSNLKAAGTIAMKRAERAHRAAMQSIKDDGLTGPEAAIAKDKADTVFERAKAENRAGTDKRMLNLRRAFESNRVPGVYFPLARFGSYFSVARDASGKVVSFSRFEKVADQKAEAERMKGLGYDVDQGILSNADDVRGAVDPRFISDIEAMLEDAGASGDLKDAVWQRWLETMPDMSVRTNRIHRKGQAGYTNDALRAFTSNQFHGAHQLARLRYGLDMQERINEAEEEARRQSDPNRAMAVVNEARLRHEFAMKPTGAPWTTWATSAAFVWYLGATPAAAIVNLSQTTVMGPAILSASMPKQGTTGALKALRDAAKDFMRAKGDPLKSEFLSAADKAALEEAYRRGSIDKTQSHDIAAIADSGVEYSGVRERAMRVVSAPFHYAEVFNRTVTFLAAYRMARTEGDSEAAAIDRAISLTKKTHFDYQNTARPRFMQGDVAKVLTIFRQFTVNTLFRAARDLHQWTNGATQEDRDEARRQFVGISLSMMAHAGITGTWGYGVITAALAILTPGADDEDIDRYLQNALLLEGDGIGAAAWNYTMGMALNGVPGHVTGIALSERIGMPNLWFRDQNYDLEGAAWMERLFIEMMGPAASIPIGMARGAQYAGEGSWVKGFEAAVPKVVRDIVKAGRYGVEGVTTRRGEPIVENVNIGHMIKTAIGFMPADVKERYEQNSRMRGEEREIQNKRSDVLAAARSSIIDDRRLSRSALDAVIAFNRQFPEYPITNDTIRNSVRSSMRASAQNEFGIRLNPRLNRRIRDAEAPLIYG